LPYDLEALVGEWRTSVAGEAVGTTTFEWLEGGGFLVQRSTVNRPEFPDGICIIGATGPNASLQQHYFDSRGVARIYEMTLQGGLWTLWRDGPDWPQRFTGRLGEDGNTITGQWERGSELGAALEHDFDIEFARAR
jgi:hypothetical protein